MQHRSARGARTARRLLGNLLATVLATVGVLSAAAACSSTPGPDATIDAFLAGWAKGDLVGVTLNATNGQPLPAEQATAELTALEGDLVGRRPTLARAGRPTAADGRASATVDVSWPLAAGVTWKYQTTVHATEGEDGWVVTFEPATVHPELHSGDTLRSKRTGAGRGTILDGSGQPIVSDQPVVTVGIHPKNVTDLAGLVRKLDAAFRSIDVEIDLTTLPNEVAAAKPDAFVEVITLRRPAYDKIRTQIRDLPGTVFVEGTRSLAPTREFARALLGGVGDVTKEIMDENPGRFGVGDVVGLGGVQQRYDDVLRGTPGVTVTIGGRAAGSEKELFTTEPKAGGSVKLTLDVRTQNAADAALGATKQRSALIAIRVSDGAVLAVANGPAGGELNLALTAQVPPGSTFKTVTALGVLDNGSATADTVVTCPKTLTVDGRTFKNAHDFVLGDVPLRTDFAKSCNTAFAALAPKLGPDGLAATATTLGIGVPWDLGVEAFTGKVSTGGSASERAAAAFGQGTTIVSPIALASAAAAIARGRWQQPTLVLDPAPANPAAPGAPLKAEAVGPLRSMMREVVTSGTATGLASVAGAPIHAKTGTAEYDNDPSHTHSWVMGYRGDIAFAVFVENGGDSSDSAVPIAGRFFTTLG